MMFIYGLSLVSMAWCHIRMVHSISEIQMLLSPSLLCHKDTAQNTQSPFSGLSLCLYGVIELVSAASESRSSSEPLCLFMSTNESAVMYELDQ